MIRRRDSCALVDDVFGGNDGAVRERTTVRVEAKYWFVQKAMVMVEVH